MCAQRASRTVREESGSNCGGTSSVSMRSGVQAALHPPGGLARRRGAARLRYAAPMAPVPVAVLLYVERN